MTQNIIYNRIIAQKKIAYVKDIWKEWDSYNNARMRIDSEMIDSFDVIDFLHNPKKSIRVPFFIFFDFVSNARNYIGDDEDVIDELQFDTKDKAKGFLKNLKNFKLDASPSIDSALRENGKTFVESIKGRKVNYPKMFGINPDDIASVIEEEINSKLSSGGRIPKYLISCTSESIPSSLQVEEADMENNFAVLYFAPNIPIQVQENPKYVKEEHQENQKHKEKPEQPNMQNKLVSAYADKAKNLIQSFGDDDFADLFCDFYLGVDIIKEEDIKNCLVESLKKNGVAKQTDFVEVVNRIMPSEPDTQTKIDILRDIGLPSRFARDAKKMGDEAVNDVFETILPQSNWENLVRHCANKWYKIFLTKLRKRNNLEDAIVKDYAEQNGEDYDDGIEQDVEEAMSNM